MDVENEVPEHAETPVQEPAKPAPKVPSREDAFKDVQGRIIALTPKVADAAREHERCKEETKIAKALWEGKSAELTELCMELVEIDNGTWQPRLPFPSADTSGPKVEDPADSAALDVLTEHGLTAKQIEKIAGSKLAAENPMRTVGDLSRAINKNGWWHRDIKGFGEAAIEKVVDALTAYRNANPLPEPADEEVAF
jgi:hypothetical protein